MRGGGGGGWVMDERKGEKQQSLSEKKPSTCSLQRVRKNILKQIDTRPETRYHVAIRGENGPLLLRMEPWLTNIVIIETAWLERTDACLLYTSPSPRDRHRSRMPSSA